MRPPGPLLSHDVITLGDRVLCRRSLHRARSVVDRYVEWTLTWRQIDAIQPIRHSRGRKTLPVFSSRKRVRVPKYSFSSIRVKNLFSVVLLFNYHPATIYPKRLLFDAGEYCTATRSTRLDVPRASRAAFRQCRTRIYFRSYFFFAVFQ